MAANPSRADVPVGHDPALRTGRILWLLVTVAAMLLYLPGAQAYYRALLADPFTGSTFSFPWHEAHELVLAFGQAGLSPQLYAGLTIGRQVVVGLACLVIASLVVMRATDRGAQVIAGLLLVMGTVVASNTAALGNLGTPWTYLGSALNVLSSTSTFTLAYIFPDGRFVPRWFRWPWLILMIINLGLTFAGSSGAAGLGRSVLLSYGFGLFIIAQATFLVIAPLYRYARDASAIQRQQLKWVLVALTTQPIIWLVGAFGLPALFPALTRSLAGALVYNLVRQSIQDLALLLVPITIGVAILRYRLFDIDVIIRRTLVYTALSIVLALTYFGSVLVLQNIFQTLTGQGQNAIATVLSTLIIAALFVPVRGRLQRTIDRRFYRQKYDATRTLAAFGAQARDVVALEELSDQLVSAVEQTMQPAQVSLWLSVDHVRERGPQHLEQR